MDAGSGRSLMLTVLMLIWTSWAWCREFGYKQSFGRTRRLRGTTLVDKPPVAPGGLT